MEGIMFPLNNRRRGLLIRGCVAQREKLISRRRSINAIWLDGPEKTRRIIELENDLQELDIIQNYLQQMKFDGQTGTI